MTKEERDELRQLYERHKWLCEYGESQDLPESLQVEGDLADACGALLDDLDRLERENAILRSDKRVLVGVAPLAAKNLGIEP